MYNANNPAYSLQAFPGSCIYHSIDKNLLYANIIIFQFQQMNEHSSVRKGLARGGREQYTYLRKGNNILYYVSPHPTFNKMPEDFDSNEPKLGTHPSGPPFHYNLQPAWKTKRCVHYKLYNVCCPGRNYEIRRRIRKWKDKHFPKQQHLCSVVGKGQDWRAPAADGCSKILKINFLYQRFHRLFYISRGFFARKMMENIKKFISMLSDWAFDFLKGGRS